MKLSLHFLQFGSIMVYMKNNRRECILETILLKINTNLRHRNNDPKK